MEGLRQISQVLPSTPLLQKHWPVSLSHWALCAEVLTPGKKQAQSERSKNKKTKKTKRVEEELVAQAFSMIWRNLGLICSNLRRDKS